MGIKLLWSGLTLILAFDAFFPGIKFIGQVLMIIGIILLILDK